MASYLRTEREGLVWLLQQCHSISSKRLFNNLWALNIMCSRVMVYFCTKCSPQIITIIIIITNSSFFCLKSRKKKTNKWANKFKSRGWEPKQVCGFGRKSNKLMIRLVDSRGQPHSSPRPQTNTTITKSARPYWNNCSIFSQNTFFVFVFIIYKFILYTKCFWQLRKRISRN